MRNGSLVAVLATVLTAIVLVAGASAAISVGANDDTGKFAADGGAAFFERMRKLGLEQTVMTVRYVPSQPSTIQGKDFLDRAIVEATSRGLRTIFAMYPYPPREIVPSPAGAQAFAEYVGRVAETYPQVRQFVIGNEPNQPAFWRPQLSKATGMVISAPIFGLYLAAAYDTLKAIDPTIKVIGAGLSPRGNDNHKAKSNISSSPMRFMAALGAWYRKSGRIDPIMDGFSYHPYPLLATDPLTRSYIWPAAGFMDLARVKQAIWDAFNGTPQPTTVDGLNLYLDEVGWQVDTSGLSGYTGSENVAVTSEAKQASTYAELVRRAACDPDIAQLNIFGFYDDASRDAGFQAALHRVDGTPRASASSVAAAISQAKGSPCGRVAPWRPARTVSGASLSTPKRQNSGALKALVGAKEGATAVVCPIAATSKTTRLTTAARSLESQAVGKCWRGKLTPLFRRQVTLHLRQSAGFNVLVAARIVAETNPDRLVELVKTPVGPLRP